MSNCLPVCALQESRLQPIRVTGPLVWRVFAEGFHDRGSTQHQQSDWRGSQTDKPLGCHFVFKRLVFDVYLGYGIVYRKCTFTFLEVRLYYGWGTELLEMSSFRK